MMGFLCLWDWSSQRTGSLLNMISRRGKYIELVILDLSLSLIDDVIRERGNPTGRLLTVENHA